MANEPNILDQIPGLYRIISLDILRRTPGVKFDQVPLQSLRSIDAIDRVLHEKGALSPGPVGQVARPWYMHPCQDDNLIVLHGTRRVEIYNQTHGRKITFEVTPDRIIKNSAFAYEGPAMLVWPRRVFHRIESLDEGSASLNFAVHYNGFDIRTNFNIYDLDLESGQFKVIREGFKDQP